MPLSPPIGSYLGQPPNSPAPKAPCNTILISWTVVGEPVLLGEGVAAIGTAVTEFPRRDRLGGSAERLRDWLGDPEAARSTSDLRES